MLFCINHSSTGVLLLGGYTGDGDSYREVKTDEIFPSQACSQSVCSIPDLAQGRPGHTLSILSSGLFVVCGGYGEDKSDPDDDSGYGNEGYGNEGYGNEGIGEGYSNVEGNGRSTRGYLDTCLVLTNYGAATASWVLHDTKMRFEVFRDLR